MSLFYPWELVESWCRHRDRNHQNGCYRKKQPNYASHGRKTWFEARNKKLKHLMNSKLTLTWGHWLVGIHCSVVHWPMTITASKSYVLVLVLLWVQILPSRNCFRISHCVGHSKMEDGQSLFSEVQGLLAEREWPKRLLLSFDLCNMMRLKHHQKERIRFSA